MYTTLGALIGLLLAIWLIINKIHPVYGLMTGALAGGLAGGLSLIETVNVMVDGVRDVSPAVIRILSAGVLSGVLIETGAAAKISNTIILRLGRKHIYLALSFATFLLCAVGVFIDVAVITVAPIALSIHQRLDIPTSFLLLAMIGGGKSGNIISPNPNTIIAAENFNTDLSSVMFAGIIPAFIGLVMTMILVKWISQKKQVSKEFVFEVKDESHEQLSLWSSLMAPLVTIVLLALRPLFGVVIDPLIALPLGGVAGILSIRCWKKVPQILELGLQKMAPVATLLIGTGTIAGVIKNSDLNSFLLWFLNYCHLSDSIVAPVSGALMSAATASTTAGAMLASASFADTLISVGIPGVWGALMVNAGATVLDHLPHGSFFHTTGGVCGLIFKDRLKLIPYETLIGMILAVSSALLYFFIS